MYKSIIKQNSPIKNIQNLYPYTNLKKKKK